MSSILRVETTASAVAAEIKAEIQSGALPPGTALRHEELAERFGVSRLPVRDALFKLEAEGLVEIRPNRGAFVVALGPADIAEIYDLRVLLEGEALERAIAAMTAGNNETITRALEAAEQAAYDGRWAEADDAFHLTIYGLSGRPRLVALIEGLRAAVQKYWAQYSVLTANTEQWLRDHRAIYRCCLERKPTEARALLQDHLLGAAEKLRQDMMARG